MKCPTCPEATLMMSDRQGIEIDYCPQCRGVWLDRGELDKIIERTSHLEAPREAPREAHLEAPRETPLQSVPNASLSNAPTIPQSSIPPMGARPQNPSGGILGGVLGEVTKEISRRRDRDDDDYRRSQRGYDDDDYDKGRKRKKKSGLLGELFDFD